MLCLSIGFFAFGLFEDSVPLMIACNALKGVGLGMSGGMALGMVADAILYGELKTGVNAVGWVLAGAGFDASLDAQGIAQPESVITAIKFMYNYIPMIMCAVIFVMMLLFFHLDKDLKKLKIEKGME